MEEEIKEEREELLEEDSNENSIDCSLPHKFKTTESLLQAYTALEAEFTRKSQKLKEVEIERDELRGNIAARAEEIESPVANSPDVKDSVNNEEIINTENIDSRVKEAVIKDYLRAFSNNSMPSVIQANNSTFNTVPSVKPATLTDVKSAVLAFFENKKN